MKKIFKTYINLLGGHLSAILIILFFYAMLHSIIKSTALLTGIACFVYVTMIYTIGWEAGNKDAGRITDFYPSFKSIMISVLIFLIFPSILLILRVLVYHIYPTVWQPYGENFELIEVSSPLLLTTDLLYRLYNGYLLFPLKNGKLVLYFIPLLLPLILFPFAYWVGLKRFSLISRYLPVLLYKNKKDKK